MAWICFTFVNISVTWALSPPEVEPPHVTTYKNWWEKTGRVDEKVVEPGGLFKGNGNTIISNGVDPSDSGSRIWVWCFFTPYRPPKKTKEEFPAETSFWLCLTFHFQACLKTLLVFSGVLKSSRNQKKATDPYQVSTYRFNNCLSYIAQFAIRMRLSQLGTILPGCLVYLQAIHDSTNPRCWAICTQRSKGPRGRL